MPMLPITVYIKLISDIADPISSSCCSIIKFVVGGRIKLPAKEAGNNSKAKIHEDLVPKIPITPAKNNTKNAPLHKTNFNINAPRTGAIIGDIIAID